MTDPLGKATANKDWLAKIGNYIPGFSGYLDAKRRQETDRIVREQAAKKVEKTKEDLKKAVQALSDNFEIKTVERISDLENRVNELAGKIRHAGDGYAGMLNTIKVTQKDLEDLYRFDLNLLEAVEELQVTSAEIKKNRRDAAECEEALDKFEEVLERIKDYLGTRKDGILGLV